MTDRSKPFIDFAAVKSAVTLVQVLDRYDFTASLKQSGTDNLRGCCPIHQGDSANEFSVSISKSCWNCFSDCKKGGNLLDFVAAMEDVTVHEAALLLDEWFDLNLAKSNGSKPAKKPKKPKRRKSKAPKADPLEKPAAVTSNSSASGESNANKPLGFELQNLKTDHPYFEERGITPETVERFGLGFCDRGTMSGRIVFPIHNPDGALVGYAGRWPGEPPEERPKYKLPKGFGKSLEVFNLHRAKSESSDLPLVIVEGYFDCLALWQAGIARCVSLMGSSLSDAQERLIADSLPRSGQIEILFDEDEAGRKGRDEAASRLARHAFVRVISLPEEGLQPDRLAPEELASVFE